MHTKKSGKQEKKRNSMLGFSSTKDFLWKMTSLQLQVGSRNWLFIARLFVAGLRYVIMFYMIFGAVLL
jgi:hypothetical protein